MPILCLMNQLDPSGPVFQLSLKAPHLQTHSKGQFKIWFLHYNPYFFSDRINALDMKNLTVPPLGPFNLCSCSRFMTQPCVESKILVSIKGLKIYEICFEMEIPPFQNFPRKDISEVIFF